MCCLILMMFLTISPMHCFMYIFLSHLSSLIVLDFVFVPFHPTVLYIPLDLCLINFFHADFLSFSAAFISTPVSLLIELTLLQKVCWRFYLHCSLTMFFAMCSSLLFIMLWYSIIALYCKYSLAVHIRLHQYSCSYVDTGTCSNCLSALLCQVSTICILSVCTYS